MLKISCPNEHVSYLQIEDERGFGLIIARRQYSRRPRLKKVLKQVIVVNNKDKAFME
jgi:hypothetical protein